MEKGTDLTQSNYTFIAEQVSKQEAKVGIYCSLKNSQPQEPPYLKILFQVFPTFSANQDNPEASYVKMSDFHFRLSHNHNFLSLLNMRASTKT